MSSDSSAPAHLLCRERKVGCRELEKNKCFSDFENNAYGFLSDHLKHKAKIFFKLHADPLLVISEPLFGSFYIPEKRSLPGPKPARNIREKYLRPDNQYSGYFILFYFFVFNLFY